MLIPVGCNSAFSFGKDILGYGQFGNGSAFLLLCVEPGIKQDQENPLSPAKILAIRRCQASIPVVGKSQHLQLACKLTDVLFRTDARRHIVKNGIFFGGQSKGIVAHRV